jgi:hypothetical protein
MAQCNPKNKEKLQVSLVVKSKRWLNKIQKYGPDKSQAGAKVKDMAQ